MGYFHSLYTSQTFTQTVNGNYVAGDKHGVAALSANISAALGYDFSQKKDWNFEGFMCYQWIGSTYYWSLITIRPNGLLHAGIRFSPFSSDE